MAGDHAAGAHHEALLQVRGQLLGPAAEAPQDHRGDHHEQAGRGPAELQDHSGHRLHRGQPDQQGVRQVTEMTILKDILYS